MIAKVYFIPDVGHFESHERSSLRYVVKIRGIHLRNYIAVKRA